MWSTNYDFERKNNDSPDIKTIYDPCPIGFMVPNPDAFSGFAPFSQASEKYVNGTFDQINNVWNVYASPNKTGAFLSFPLMDKRDWRTGDVVQERGQASEHLYWTAYPHFYTESGIDVVFYYKVSIWLSDSEVRSTGCSIRPVREE